MPNQVGGFHEKYTLPLVAWLSDACRQQAIGAEKLFPNKVHSVLDKVLMTPM
jgi:hypothetical protein